MAFIPGAESHPLSDAVSVSNNRVFNVVQVADPSGTIVDPSVGGGVEVTNDSSTPIPIFPLGVQSTGNSTTTNLGANVTFTGTGVEVSPAYGTVSVCIFSDKTSATNGLKFQASIDNVSWETTEEYNYIGGSGLQSYSFAPSGRYFRVVYVNGAEATTKFVIFTVLRSGYTKSSSHRIKDNITGEKDAELVKAVLAAEKPDGEFTDIHCTAGGNLKMSLEEVNGIDAIPISDDNNSLTVDGTCYRGAYTITRPANTTPYTAGDAIGGTGGSAIFTLNNIGPSGGFIQIQSIRLMIYSGTPPTSMTTLRLHLYSAAPTSIADNAAWDLLAGDRSSYLDYIDLPTPTDMGSTLFTKVDYPGSLLKLASASTSLFGVLQTITAATFAENSTVLDLRISAIEMGR
jgi:hypothetical protein